MLLNDIGMLLNDIGMYLNVEYW